MRSNSSAINVYKKKNIKSKVVTQLLYGDTFKKLKKNGVWIKIKNDKDDYKGYIKKKISNPIKKILIKFVTFLQNFIQNQTVKIK